MKLVDLNVTAFLEKTASNEPVPGGGSISALNAAIATALGTMVTNLTIGRKKYADKDAEMTAAAEKLNAMRTRFVELIDLDTEAYDQVFAAFKLPKETDEEKAHRAAVIEEATKHAAEIPMEVARTAVEAMPTIIYIGSLKFSCCRVIAIVALIDSIKSTYNSDTIAVEGERTATLNDAVTLKFAKHEALKLRYSNLGKAIDT